MDDQKNKTDIFFRYVGYFACFVMLLCIGYTIYERYFAEPRTDYTITEIINESEESADRIEQSVDRTENIITDAEGTTANIQDINQWLQNEAERNQQYNDAAAESNRIASELAGQLTESNRTIREQLSDNDQSLATAEAAIDNAAATAGRLEDGIREDESRVSKLTESVNESGKILSGISEAGAED